MMKKLTSLPEWQALKQHHNLIKNQTMQDWFAKDPSRFDLFSLEVGDILFDYSKNRITSETVQLLVSLAGKIELTDKINDLLAGKIVNTTEQRPALHTALRQPYSSSLNVNGVDVIPEIQFTLNKMEHFVHQVREQTWRGITGKPIRDIVNIGIGGSHLGPLMATHALNDFATTGLNCHFISNIDSSHINTVLKQIDPEATLFIISSKSFTTLETMTNAKIIYAWLQQKLGTNDLSKHFVAVTANMQRALDFGIPAEQIFLLWDWVGGRYSVWSAIGLPLALMIGMENFLAFLKGGYQMDQHFHQSDLRKNMPVLLALIGIWYINFFDAKSHAVVPYTHQLNYFRAHLQQLDMESNGKNTTHGGDLIDYPTGPIIWGEHGGTGQHAFHQLLHQGQHFVPVDFILAATTEKNFDDYQDILISCCLSQAEALLKGKSYEQAFHELKEAGFSDSEATLLARHKSVPGNRPCNIIFLREMNPFNLGALLALYEHKVFVQGSIWGINSFDQWGVELGKQLLPRILDDLKNDAVKSSYDASTLGLIKHYKKQKV